MNITTFDAVGMAVAAIVLIALALWAQGFRSKTRDLIGARNTFFAISAVLLVVSIGAMLFKGFNFGMDFQGGTLVEVGFTENQDKITPEVVRNAIKAYSDENKLDFQDAQVQVEEKGIGSTKDDYRRTIIRIGRVDKRSITTAEVEGMATYLEKHLGHLYRQPGKNLDTPAAAPSGAPAEVPAGTASGMPGPGPTSPSGVPGRKGPASPPSAAPASPAVASGAPVSPVTAASGAPASPATATSGAPASPVTAASGMPASPAAAASGVPATVASGAPASPAAAASAAPATPTTAASGAPKATASGAPSAPPAASPAASNNDISSALLARETIDPIIGSELWVNSLLALLVALVLQLLYITLRFGNQIRYGLAVDVALIHDVIIMAGLYSLTSRQVDSPFLAALLTVIGYSVMDSIVVFDRIRENVRHSRKGNYAEICNASVNQTMSRSVNTTLTVLLTLFALYFFGGDTLRNFAFALLVGVTSGAYSSIFIATPLCVIFDDWAKQKEEERVSERRRAREAAAEAPRESRAASAEPPAHLKRRTSDVVGVADAADEGDDDDDDGPRRANSAARRRKGRRRRP